MVPPGRALALSIALSGCGRTGVDAFVAASESDASTPRECVDEFGVVDPNAFGPPAPVIVDGCSSLGEQRGPFAGGEEGRLGPATVICNPSRENSTGPWRCCSDDPAAPNGEVPGYASISEGPRPYFSGANNSVGDKGICVRVGEVEPALVEEHALGCPIPCNPTWDRERIGALCGPTNVCCQSVRLHPRDCVLDPELLPEEYWRPARSEDIWAEYPDGSRVTDWSVASHWTHQGYGGLACGVAAGNPPAPEWNSDPVWIDCVEQLTVADQRGFCVQPDHCVADPSCLDACELMNTE